MSRGFAFRVGSVGLVAGFALVCAGCGGGSAGSQVVESVSAVPSSSAVASGAPGDSGAPDVSGAPGAQGKPSRKGEGARIDPNLSPESVLMTPGRPAVGFVTVPPRAESFSVALHWIEGDFDYVVVAPDGTKYTAAQPRGAQTEKTSTFSRLEVKNPAAGDWTVKVSGKGFDRPVFIERTAMYSLPILVSPEAKVESSVNADGSVTLRGVPGKNSDVVAYMWDFGDGRGGEGQTVTHTFGKGQFVPALIAEDRNGEKGFVTAPFVIVVSGPGRDGVKIVQVDQNGQPIR